VHFVVAKSLPEGEDSKWFALCSPIEICEGATVRFLVGANINYITRYYLII